jgi:hypothetical protein
MGKSTCPGKEIFLGESGYEWILIQYRGKAGIFRTSIINYNLN